MTETLATHLVNGLAGHGADRVFAIPGVHNTELFRGLTESGIAVVLPRHEQSAGFMADGFARATGRPGVCFVVTGPGLTNVLTAFGEAWSDSVPVLVVSTASTVAGKGIVDETHPASLGCALPRQATREYLRGCDLAVVVGSELSRTDFGSEGPLLPDRVVRIDIDAQALATNWRADVALLGDSGATLDALAALIDLRPGVES